MQSCPSRRESEAAPSNGGLFAIHAAFPRLFARIGFLIRRGACPPGASRFGVWPVALLVALFLWTAWLPTSAHAADAGAGTPVIPALQSLINSATVAPASSASGASAAEAASAPSPASQAEIARSLDSVIATLDNDRQRSALVAQLKKLRDVSRTVGPLAPAPAQQSPGLLGAIASGIA